MLNKEICKKCHYVHTLFDVTTPAIIEQSLNWFDELWNQPWRGCRCSMEWYRRGVYAIPVKSEPPHDCKYILEQLYAE